MNKFLGEIFEQSDAIEKMLAFYISSNGSGLLEEVKNVIRIIRTETFI